MSYRRLRHTLVSQSRSGLICPVLFGSAMTGAGTAELALALTELLPCAAAGAAGRAPAGRIFKVERGPAGEKVAYLRMFSGSVRVRDVLAYGAGHADKVTALHAIGADQSGPGDVVVAGQIARVSGLTSVQVGDPAGAATARPATGGRFAPPALETVVIPDGPADRPRLFDALVQLAEQDPLINLRQDDLRRELVVSLYGEVQKEVIQATLASEYGLAVTFLPTTAICIERVTGVGEAAEAMSDDANPFRATIGLRIAPAPAGTGIDFRLGIERGALPQAFQRAIAETVARTLREGLQGWQVADCTVTLTSSGYVPPPPHGWSIFSSSASDFRHLTPLVTMAALRRAGTEVCAPVSRFTLELPAGSLPAVLATLARLGAVSQPAMSDGLVAVIDGQLAASHVHDLQLALPGLTGGEGVLDTTFAGYQRAAGPVPVRSRSDHNPLCREEYLLHVQRGV